MRDRFFLGCCWAGGWVCGATMATGGVWAAGVTAGGVVGVRGEVGVEGAEVAGLGPLLYMGALCLNCAGSAGLGVLGSSGGRLACRPASREDGAMSRVRYAGGLAAQSQGPPSPREGGQTLFYLPGPNCLTLLTLRPRLQVPTVEARDPHLEAKGLWLFQTGGGRSAGPGKTGRPPPRVP